MGIRNSFVYVYCKTTLTTHLAHLLSTENLLFKLLYTSGFQTDEEKQQGIEYGFGH